jgi:ABC-type antimicrobial peptide transport system permease subunit
VIGVVADTRQRSLVPTGSEARLMQYYVPLSQVPPPPSFAPAGPRVSGLVVRTTGKIQGLDTAIRRTVLDGRMDTPFLYVRPYATVLDRQIRPWRTGTTLFALFSGLAVLVAATGLYSAFAHAVGERRREMAIRVAIGARPQRVVHLVLGEGARLAAVGIACGCLAAAVSGRWTASVLFGTIAVDPLVLGTSAAVMLAVALLATIVPARSASRADPCELLKAE